MHRGSWRSPTQKISDFEVATMLMSEREFVMGKPQKKYDPSQDQEQAQANLQGQLQGETNLQGQGQGQGQDQAQGQAQLAVQSLDSKSNNDDSNDNSNSNDNKNSLDNKVNNNVENTVENTVDTKVNVDVSLDLHATGLSSPVIDLHGFSANDSLVMPEVVNQTLNGGGNMFHLDQVNNIIGDTKIEGATVSYGGSTPYDAAGGFSKDAKVTGGDSKIDGASMGAAVGAGSGIVSHVDATLTQSAFTQTITTGANIQFNSETIQAAGQNLTDDHHTL